MSALFFCFIKSLISSFHQGTWFFLTGLEVFLIAISAALVMDSKMKVVSSSIVLVSDWGLSCINVSTSVEKKGQSGFFNLHLCVKECASVLVDSSVIRIGK